MIHKEFWGILFLLFVGWIFIPGTPNTRIEHACAPIGWSGNVVTSLSALALPNTQQTAQRWFDKFEYGCQYTVWRLIYQDEYNKWAAANNKPLAGQVAKAPAKAASSAASDAEVEAAMPNAPPVAPVAK